MEFEPRTYRRTVRPDGLASFEVVDAETDLQIVAERDLGEQAAAAVRRVRAPLERYVSEHPHFLATFAPVDTEEDAPEIVRAMAAAARAAGVGPMAAVAGAVAERVARELASSSRTVIVENGGDVFLIGSEERIVALWAGDGGPAGLGVRVPASVMPVAACTSSGRFGHSTSLGRADAVMVLAADGALSDAVATATANRIHTADDIASAIDFARAIPGVLGVLATIDHAMGAWGGIELVPVSA